MSYLTGIKKIEEIIDSTTITNWYQAAVLSFNHGDLVNSFTDASGNNVHLLQANNTLKPTFEIDAQGYKCVRFYSSDAMVSSVTKPYNTDETFIAICKVNVNPGASRFVFRQYGGFNRIYFQGAKGIFTEATDYISGSGDFTLAMSTAFTDADKIAIVIQRRASVSPLFKIWDKKKYSTGGFSNTTYAGAGAWNILTGTSWDVSVYEMLVVNEFLADEKVNQLVRTMSFKNGAKA